MNQPLRAACLTLTLLLTQAGAQNLDLYSQLAGALDRAAATAPQSRSSASAELERATAALGALLPTLPGGTDGRVGQTLRSTIAQAQAAVARTPAEVQANVLLARGLMRRVLYDQTIGTLPATPNPANDSAALQLLGREMGFTASSLEVLRTQARNGRKDLVDSRLRRVAADKLRLSLQAVGLDKPQAENYLNLTRASSWFSLVQDDGRQAIPPITVAQFDRALQYVAIGDLDGLDSELTQMRQSADDLSRTLLRRSQATQPPASQTAPSPNNPAPTLLLPSDQVLNATYAALAQAQTAAGHGNPARARELLGQALTLMSELPPEMQRTPAFSEMQRNTRILQNRMALRPNGIQSLIATLGTAEAQAAGGSVVGSDSFSTSSVMLLGGWVRVFLSVALAVLSVAALRFLSLAFGGSNMYWRAIYTGLFSLLTPFFLEGLFGLLGWVGDMLDKPLLRGAFNLTLSQGAGGLLIQALLSFFGVGMLAYGFRGLCKQFGLLSSRMTPTAAPARPASRYTETSLDWTDEL